MIDPASLILVAASPLAKMFQKRWTVRESGKAYTMEVEQLVDDPDRVFKDEEFSILVPFSSGAEQLWFGIPKPVQDPMRREVLAGGDDGISFAETDWTGIVDLRLGVDTLSMILGQFAGAQQSVSKNDIVSAIQDARNRSNVRCMRQARKVYRALKDQREKLKESGSKATYAPSVAEFLCAHVLANEEKLLKQKADNMREKIDNLIGMVEARDGTNQTL